MNSEERFLQNIRGQFEHFSPEVPASVYKGMRRRMFWGNFMRFDASRFNAWYLLALMGATVGGIAAVNTAESIVAQEAQGVSILAEGVVPSSHGPLSVSCSPIICTANAVEKSTQRSAAPSITIISPISESTTSVIATEVAATATDEAMAPAIPEVVAPEKISDSSVQLPSASADAQEIPGLMDQLNNGNGEIHLNTKVYKKK